jgi:hypothetical protein
LADVIWMLSERYVDETAGARWFTGYKRDDNDYIRSAWSMEDDKLSPVFVRAVIAAR